MSCDCPHTFAALVQPLKMLYSEVAPKDQQSKYGDRVDYDLFAPQSIFILILGF